MTHVNVTVATIISNWARKSGSKNRTRTYKTVARGRKHLIFIFMFAVRGLTPMRGAFGVGVYKAISKQPGVEEDRLEQGLVFRKVKKNQYRYKTTIGKRNSSSSSGVWALNLPAVRSHCRASSSVSLKGQKLAIEKRWVLWGVGEIVINVL